MNPKFFDVKKEKQDAIINACLKVFAENGYKKASTDVIVKTAGISKGLLFHYFESKKGAYEFIYDYSVKYMMLELSQSVRKDEHDFFEIQRTIEGVKTRVMRNYPYMQQFIDSIRFENHPDALEAIGDDRDVLGETYNSIYRQADMTRFDDFVDVNRVINMISWMSEGFIKDRFREDEEPDLDAMNDEFSGYLVMLRDHLYKPGYHRSSFIRPLDTVSGNRIIMSGLREREKEKDKKKEAQKEGQKESRMSSLSQLARQLNRAASEDRVKKASELSFEERLARRDTSVFGVPIPKKTEKKAGEKAASGKSENRTAKEAGTGKAAEPVKESEKVRPFVKEDKSGELKSTESAVLKEEKKEETAVRAEEIKETPAEKETSAAEALTKETGEAKAVTGAKEAEGREEQLKEAVTETVKAEAEAEAVASAESEAGTEPVTEPGTDMEKAVTEAAIAGINNEEASRESADTIAREISAADGASDSDMIDLSALYSKRLEEAVEDLEVSISGQLPPKEEAVNIESIDQGREDMYAFGGQDMTGFSENYDEQGYYGAELPYQDGIYMDENGMSMFPGAPMYQDYYEDDSAAYAELYNSVNNYDMNGATQEMPVNEVLAYRNAFTNEYMKEELDRQGKSSQGVNQESGKKEKKAKRKSFFSGLFGKKNGEETEESAENGSDIENQQVEQAKHQYMSENASQSTGQQTAAQAPGYISAQQDLNAMGAAPVLPEYDPEMIAQMRNYETPNYYGVKY